MVNTMKQANCLKQEKMIKKDFLSKKKNNNMLITFALIKYSCGSY